MRGFPHFNNYDHPDKYTCLIEQKFKEFFIYGIIVLGNSVIDIFVCIEQRLEQTGDACINSL